MLSPASAIILSLLFCRFAISRLGVCKREETCSIIPVLCRFQLKEGRVEMTATSQEFTEGGGIRVIDVLKRGPWERVTTYGTAALSCRFSASERG